MALLVAIVVGMLRETITQHTDAATRAELWGMAAMWLALMLFAAFDVARSVGWGTVFGGMQFICASLLLFVGVQAYLLANGYTNLIVDQAKLNRELGARVDEVTVLNEELRRKVGDRSRELSTALRKLRIAGEDELTAGTVLGEHYRVLDRLGAGAMGAVYRVERLSDSRSMAAKVVRGRLRPDTLERFTREAELAARVITRTSSACSTSTSPPMVSCSSSWSWSTAPRWRTSATGSGTPPSPARWSARWPARCARSTRRASCIAISSPRTSSSQKDPT
jgi:hypothetical protein